MNNFVPDMYQKSIYHIDYDKLADSGIKCILLDLDNTSVPYKDKEPNKRLIDLVNELKDEFKVIIFSNATKKRILPFKKALNVDCLARAGKPGKKSFLKVLKLFNYELSDVVIIGDQLYMDILGGNRVGIKTILVNPMSRDDMFFTKYLIRPFEKLKYKELEKKQLLKRGNYYE